MRLSQRVINWAKAVGFSAVAAILLLVVFNIAASYFTDVSHTTETIVKLTPSITRLVGIQ